MKLFITKLPIGEAIFRSKEGNIGNFAWKYNNYVFESS